jgi:hypothetical protein
MVASGLVRWVGLLSLAVALSVCVTSGDYCDAKCNCEGCGPHDYDHCEIDFDRDEEHVALHNCDDFWEEYLDCVTDERACFEGDFDYGCSPERDRLSACLD